MLFIRHQTHAGPFCLMKSPKLLMPEPDGAAAGSSTLPSGCMIRRRCSLQEAQQLQARSRCSMRWQQKSPLTQKQQRPIPDSRQCQWLSHLSGHGLQTRASRKAKGMHDQGLQRTAAHAMLLRRQDAHACKHAARTMDPASCEICRGIVCPSQAVACCATQASSNEGDKLGHGKSLRKPAKVQPCQLLLATAQTCVCQVNGL